MKRSLKGIVSKKFEGRLERLERGGAELKDVYSFLENKKKLEEIGLDFNDLKKFMELEKHIGLDMLKKMKALEGSDKETVGIVLDTVPHLKEIGIDFSTLKESGEIAEALREQGLAPSGFKGYLKAFGQVRAALAGGGGEKASGFDPEFFARLSRELEKLKKRGFDTKNIMKTLSNEIVEFQGLDSSIIELTKKKTEMDSAVTTLSNQKNKLEVEVEAKKFEAKAKEEEVKKLAEQKAQLIGAIQLVKGSITDIKTTQLTSKAYDTILSRLKKTHEAAAKTPEDAKKLAEERGDVVEKNDKDSRMGDEVLGGIIEDVSEFNRAIKELELKKNTLETERAQLAKECKELQDKIEPVKNLWRLVSPKATEKDFIDGLEWFLKKYKDEAFSAKDKIEITREVRNSLINIHRWVMDEMVVSKEEHNKLKAETEALKEKISKETVPKWKYDNLREEKETLQKAIKEEMIPKWKYDVQEEQVKFLSRELFDKNKEQDEKDKKKILQGYV
jgi:prefoldin subunit 5